MMSKNSIFWTDEGVTIYLRTDFERAGTLFSCELHEFELQVYV